MLLVLWVIAVMVGAPIAIGIACNVAMRWPSLGVAVAVAMVSYAWKRADDPVVIANMTLPFIGKLVAAALAVAGSFVAIAALVGSVCKRPEPRELPQARWYR